MLESTWAPWLQETCPAMAPMTVRRCPCRRVHVATRRNWTNPLPGIDVVVDDIESIPLEQHPTVVVRMLQHLTHGRDDTRRATGLPRTRPSRHCRQSRARLRRPSCRLGSPRCRPWATQDAATSRLRRAPRLAPRGFGKYFRQNNWLSIEAPTAQHVVVTLADRDTKHRMRGGASDSPSQDGPTGSNRCVALIHQTGPGSVIVRSEQAAVDSRYPRTRNASNRSVRQHNE